MTAEKTILEKIQIFVHLHEEAAQPQKWLQESKLGEEI